LLGQGLTIRSSGYGGFFYLIVGAHGLHVLGGLVAFALALRDVGRGTASRDQILATRIFWLFVVLLWPILYWRVYL
jgi:cytochrome c oxidase subunit 3